MELTLTAPRPAAARRVQVTLRAYPYPCAAMLAICSDLDETPDRRVYLEIARFLSTTQPTAMGSGVGLEVGNSIYFDMPRDQFAWYTTDDAGRDMIRTLIHSGHIDVLHSYGDGVRRRDQVKTCLDELVRGGCHLKVWVDHSKAVTNFGPDLMCGEGDVRSSAAYHADLTLAYGIRYVWRGRTSGITGQDAPIGISGLAGMLHPVHPLSSARAMLKEGVKICLGRRRHPRWEMYAANRVLRVSTLRDGQRVWEFLRSNPFWGGSAWGDTADGIAEVLTERTLRTLVRRRGVCVLYTHLGKVRDPVRPFGPAAQAALRRIARLQDEGKIFVTTTHRLLRYLSVRDTLSWSSWMEGRRLVIRLDQVRDPIDGPRQPAADELQGLTFEGPRCADAVVQLADGNEVKTTLHQTGERSVVSVPWRRLVFPDVRAWMR